MISAVKFSNRNGSPQNFLDRDPCHGAGCCRYRAYRDGEAMEVPIDPMTLVVRKPKVIPKSS